MGKLKQTKLKHRKHKDSDDNSDNDDNSINHTTKKYKILTSKNKNKLVFKEGRYYRKNDSINKKNKRSKKYFNMRTLDAIKTYGSTLKNQDGGFIINYIKYKWNMKKIKKIIAKLGRNQVEINKYIDTYKNQPETFKRLGNKKAVVIYDILRTIKDKTIIEFLLENKDNEKTYDTSNMEHDLNMIKTKIEISTANQLKQINYEIKKEKPQLEKNLTLFRKNSKKFEKINEDYSKIMAFYVEQKELSDKYHLIEKSEHLTKYDKQIKKKYLKNEENIKYILNKENLDINVINENIKKIATLMNMSNDYDTKFKDLTQEKYDTDLQKWQANYKDIYVNITDIEGGIKNVSDTLDKIKEYAEQIGFNLSSIYTAIKQSFKLDPIIKIKRIIDENLGYLKNVKEVSLKKVKYAFIEQIPIEDIEFYLPLASASLMQTEKSMNELNASFILDSSFIRTGHAGGGSDRWKGRRMGMDGAGGINGISNIGELEWFGKGGAYIDYQNLLTLTIEKFLDTEYDILIDTLAKINLDLIDNKQDSEIYDDLTNYEFLNIMKIYFNIYIFFLYYSKIRDNTELKAENNIINKDSFIVERNILNLVSIITKYETIIKDYKNDKFKNLPKTIQNEIIIYIKNLQDSQLLTDKNSGFLNTIFLNIKNSYFNKIIPRPIEKYIWNPFSNEKKTIKNLYYEYNSYDDDTENPNISCIKSFLGYYDKNDKHFTEYKDKKNCEISKNNLFDTKELHNKYKNIPILYKDSTDDKYKFTVIYYNKNIDKAPPQINIKTIADIDEINTKFEDLLTFLVLPNQIDKNAADEKKKFKKILYDNTNTISNTFKNNYNLLFCNDDSNDIIKSIINNTMPTNIICNNTDDSAKWSINYIKSQIINNWTTTCFDNTNSVTQTIQEKVPGGAAGGVLGTQYPGLNLTPANPIQDSFKTFYNNKNAAFKQNIQALLLNNIYHNIKYNENIQNYSVDRDALFTNPNETKSPYKILTILNTDYHSNTYYIILYEYDTTNDKTIIITDINNNTEMQKYLFTWLKSECNSDNDKQLKVDKFSNYIHKLYESSSHSKAKLSDLDIYDVKNIENNEFYKAFTNDDKKIFKEAYYQEFANVKTDSIKKPIVLKEDKVVNTPSNPILPRTETRLVFDLPQSLKFNEENNYNSGSSDFTKKTVLDVITKSYNKKGNYQNIPIKYMKRIVSFNVNNWNRSIDSIALINPKPDTPTLLLTDPKNAISFIKTKLPDTDILGFLDYSLYSNGAAANRHIKDKVKSTNNEGDITVDNKYSEELIKNELKLDNYFIKNDNYDNVVDIPILGTNDNMFLGKALYYDDKKTTMSKPEPLCNTSKANDILYSEILINKKSIGLYLINIYTKIENDNHVDNLIKKCIDTHTASKNLYETVIMGTFTLNKLSPAYTKEDLIDYMKTFGYSKFGNFKETCINKDPSHYYIDLCFVSDDFAKHFTILNDEIVVPSGSVSSHYPIYLDIIENQDIDIEDDDFIVFYSDENIEIKDKFMEFIFNLKLKKKPTVGGSKSSLKPKPKYTPKIIKLGSDGSYDIEIVDSSGNIITDDRYKSATIDKITNIITIKDKNGKTSMTIDKGTRKITRFEEDGTTVESTSVIDKDGTFITTDKDGKEYKTKDGVDGKAETKDSSTGEVVKSYYNSERDEVEKAKHEGKRLLSTFMDDVKKENLTMVSKNRDSILSYIKKIIDLIQTRLKPKNYEAIKLKLDTLAKNIIELKSIEPKLTPDKVLIKEYSQKARSYDWMEDVTKREKVSLSLHDEGKELEAILKTHPEIKDILPSSGENITDKDILEIITETDDTLSQFKDFRKENVQKIITKLKSSVNINILIKKLEDKYKTEPKIMCKYLNTINKQAPSILLTNKINDINCDKKKADDYQESKKKKQPYIIS